MTGPTDSTTRTPASAGNGHGAGAAGNGGRDESRPPLDLGRRPRSRRPPGPSARPAAVVFAIIALIFLVGFIADDLTSAHHPAPAAQHAAARAVPGTGGLVPEPSSDVLGPILTADEPPANVVSALVVPKGSEVVPHTATQLGLGLYDATIEVVFPGPEQHAIAFVRTELAAGSWHRVSAGPSSAGYLIVAQHPGSDGYQWELGATLSPTTFSSPVTGMSVPDTGVTPVTLRLFAISDES
jgi:hypothetical protein